MPAYNRRFGKMAGRSLLNENCSYLWLLNVVGNLVGKVRHLAKPLGRCTQAAELRWKQRETLKIKLIDNY